MAGSIWDALAGREPGRPVGPAEPDLYKAVVERLNPARARPRLLNGIETATFSSVRGSPYVMLRSPGDEPAYLRLDPAEVELAQRMDGSLTVATLVGEFARMTGRLAPAQVIRVVADLASNRMLAELPIDAFRPVRAVGARSAARRLRERAGAVLRGRPLATFPLDRFVSVLYRAGGRLVFTRAGAVLIALVAIGGAVAFGRRWIDGEHAIFVVGDSHVLGALVLLALNVVCIAAHELGHALAAKHAGRRVPTGGVMLYFGIPSVFVDTSDVWMVGRRARILTAAAGTIAALALAGAINLAAVAVPELGAAALKLGFLWYLNALFNLNPLLALDGYHVLMDWLDVPNLRSRGLVFAIARLRRRRLGWAGLSGEDRLYAMYGTSAVLWLVITLGLAARMWKDRVDGLGAALWHEGIGGRAGVLLILGLLFAPVVGALIGRVRSALSSLWAAVRRRGSGSDLPDRLRLLLGTTLASLDPARLAEIARRATWVRPRAGSVIPLGGAAAVVDAGVLEGYAPGDPIGVVRRRALVGDVIGALAADHAVECWRAGRDVRLLSLPADVDVERDPSRWRLPVPGVDVRNSSAHLGGPSPALIWPAGAPGTPDDGRADRRLTRRFLLLLFVLAWLALIAVLVAIPAGSPLAEIRRDQVLATVEVGSATITRPGGMVHLRTGDRIAVGLHETISVGAAQELTVGAAQRGPSGAALVSVVFRGGATGWLCDGSTATFTRLTASGMGPVRPEASLTLESGVAAISPMSRSPQFADLELVVNHIDLAGRISSSPTGRGSVVLVSAGRSEQVGEWCGSAPGAIANAAVASPKPSAAPGMATVPSPAASELQPADASPAPATPPASSSSSSAPPTEAPTSVGPDDSPAAEWTPEPAATPRADPTARPTARPTAKPTAEPTTPPDFTISCSPADLTAPAGSDADTACTITSTGSFSAAVTLSCSGLGKVADCSFTPSAPKPGAGKSVQSVLEIRVSSGARPGCYSFGAVGVSGALDHSDRLQLDVPPDRGASC